jgi:hypothetical protein
MICWEKNEFDLSSYFEIISDLNFWVGERDFNFASIRGQALNSRAGIYDSIRIQGFKNLSLALGTGFLKYRERG